MPTTREKIEEIRTATQLHENTCERVGNALLSLLNEIDYSHAATISVGQVLTGAPGSQARVFNAGTATNIILTFTIPAGFDGKSGEKGESGISFLSGNADPRSDVGSVDDLFLNLETRDVFKKRAGDNWELQFNLGTEDITITLITEDI